MNYYTATHTRTIHIVTRCVCACVCGDMCEFFALKKTRASGRNVGKVFNPVVKLVLENQPLSDVCEYVHANATYYPYHMTSGTVP